MSHLSSKSNFSQILNNYGRFCAHEQYNFIFKNDYLMRLFIQYFKHCAWQEMVENERASLIEIINFSFVAIIATIANNSLNFHLQTCYLVSLLNFDQTTTLFISFLKIILLQHRGSRHQSSQSSHFKKGTSEFLLP